MTVRGICIPGLTMQASELPSVPGVRVLENPEVGDGARFGRDYVLEEVAEMHARTISDLVGPKEPLVVAGISMGGMILSIMATEFRHLLPRTTRFEFLVTSPNDPSYMFLTDQVLGAWATVKPGDVDAFSVILEPFFSPGFRTANPDVCRTYYAYRARGENKQSAKSFFRQVNAVRKCEAYKYFARVEADSARFVGGADDHVFGPRHNAGLRALCPEAEHLEVDALGHMIYLEQPQLYASRFDT